MLKLAYLVQEQGCLQPDTGAFQHISSGYRELSKHFDVEFYLKGVREGLAPKRSDKTIASSVSSKPLKPRGLVYGTLKDILILCSAVKLAFRMIRIFKKERPDCIYERASYLGFSGLLAARYCRIPHFYEANGLQFESRKRYYRSLLSGPVKWMERKCYTSTDHVFFVGSYGDYWKIRKDNWTNVENGVEAELLNDEPGYRPVDGPLEICFVGRQMWHHRLDILVDALMLIEDPELVRINFIGSGFDEILGQIKERGIRVNDHGFLDRSEIIARLRTMDLGLICGSPPYSSNMKLFDYGAAGCAVLSAPVYHIRSWYPEDVLFFDGSPEDMARQIVNLARNRNLLTPCRESLFKRIGREFTWESIFSNKIQYMIKYLKTGSNSISYK